MLLYLLLVPLMVLLKRNKRKLQEREEIERQIRRLEADKAGREQELLDTNREPNDLITQQALHGLKWIPRKIKELKKS